MLPIQHLDAAGMLIIHGSAIDSCHILPEFVSQQQPTTTTAHHNSPPQLTTTTQVHISPEFELLRLALERRELIADHLLKANK